MTEEPLRGLEEVSSPQTLEVWGWGRTVTKREQRGAGVIRYGEQLRCNESRVEGRPTR